MIAIEKKRHHMIILIENWQINFQENTIENLESKVIQKLEPRTMAVLKILVDNHGEVISRETFFKQVWNGKYTVEESLTQCISKLRHVFEDNKKPSRIIKTIHKSGYKFMCKPQFVKSRKNNKLLWGVSFICIISILIVFSIIFEVDTQTRNDTSENRTASPIFIEPDNIRNELINLESSSKTLFWSTSDNENTYTIRYGEITNDSGMVINAKTSIIDEYNFVIWESNYGEMDNNERIIFIDSLIDVLRLLQKYKEAPEVATLPLNLRTKYNQARYLIDKRGEKNLIKALQLLEQIIEQKPEFIMAIVNKAVASRMLGFYQTTMESREESLYKYNLSLKQAKSISPSHPVVESLVTQINIDKQNWNDYEMILLRAIEYSPACIICVRNLAELYLNLGFYKNAEKLVIKHLDYFPLSVMMHSFLGQIYNMQADITGAKQQVKVLKALGSKGGSDSLAMEINIALNEGDVYTYNQLAAAMVKKHPLYATTKAATDAQISGNTAELERIVSNMPKLDFNLAVTTGKFDQIITRVSGNIFKGNLRDLRLTHGWQTLDSHISPSYSKNLEKLKARQEIYALFNDIGLTDYWKSKKQWPDYCYAESFIVTKAKYCFE